MNQSTHTLVCFAVKEEAGPFLRFARNRPELRILLTGMGHANAERSVRGELRNSWPKLVISAGFAGGLNPELSPGTVLYAANRQPKLAKALELAGARPGRFHCAKRVAATVREKQELWNETGVDAVEMESAIICADCAQLSIPAAIVRVILDPAQEDLPLDFNQLLTPEQQLDGRKLASALLKSPGKIPALIRLQKQSAAAANQLAMVLAKALPLAEL